MNITLSNEVEKLFVEKVNSGAYQTPVEVVCSGVRLLDAKEKGAKALRREIMRGFEDIQEGRSFTFSSNEKLEDFLVKITA